MKKSNRLFVSAALLVLVAVLSTLFFVISFQNSSYKIPERKVRPVPLDTIHFEPTVGSTETRSTTYYLEGSVVDETDHGISSAFLLVKEDKQEDQDYKAFPVDQFGRFLISIPAGIYIVQVTAPFAMQAVQKTIKISEESNQRNYFRLIRARSLGGNVLNEREEMITDAEICLYARKENYTSEVQSSQENQANLLYRTHSDYNGNFRLSPIWPGHYRLVASATGYLEYVDPSIDADQNHYVIRFGQSGKLEVKVQDKEQIPVFLANVTIESREPNKIFRASGETEQNGMYVFNDLSEGKYHISVTHNEYTTDSKSARDIDFHQNKVTCILTLNRKGYSVSGKVVENKTNTPISGFPVHLYTREGFAANSLEKTTSDTAGDFAFTNVPNGVYFLGEPDITHSSSDYTSILKHYKNALSVVVQNADVQGCRLTVYRKPVISGYVLDAKEKPVEGAYLYADLYGPLEIRSAQDGSFKFPTMMIDKEDRTAQTTIYAYHPEKGQGQSDLITYKAGSVVEGIKIILNAGITVSGKIMDIQNHPIFHALVQSRSCGCKQNFTVDETGSYQIDNLPFNMFSLIVSASGYSSEARSPFYEKPLKRVREDFYLKKEEDYAKIQGIVVDKNGIPMNEVKVQCREMKYFYDPNDNEGFVTTQTQSDGSFLFQNLEENKTYTLIAEIDTTPPFKTRVSGIPSNTMDVILRLDFEPVTVTVSFETTKMKNSSIQDSQSMLYFIACSDSYNVRQVRVLSNFDDQVFVADTPGRYLFYLRNISVFASRYIDIDDNTSKNLPVTLELDEINPEGSYYLIGRCVDLDGKTVYDQYRITCWLLDISPNPYILTLEAPLSLTNEGYFLFPLRYPGTYELIYSTCDNQIFNRQIIELSKSMGEPYGEKGSIAIALPDIVLRVGN